MLVFPGFGGPDRSFWPDVRKDVRPKTSVFGLIFRFASFKVEKAHCAARNKGPENRKNEAKLPPLCAALKHSMISILLRSEEDKRATTNVQNRLVFFFFFSFILFSSLF